MPAERSFVSSRIKQAKRDTIIGYLEGSFPDPEEPLRAFTLPGAQGFDNPNGVERWILGRNPKNILWCADNTPRGFMAIPIEHRVSKSPRDASEIFSKAKKPVPLDLIFLDWMGAFGPDEEKTLEHIFSRGWLSPRGILATTICAAGRLRPIHRQMFQIKREEFMQPQWLAAFYQDRVRTIARDRGWKSSEKSYAEPYSCYDRKPKAIPMILSILIGMGNYNAYSSTWVGKKDVEEKKENSVS